MDGETLSQIIAKNIDGVDITRAESVAAIKSQFTNFVNELKSSFASIKLPALRSLAFDIWQTIEEQILTFTASNTEFFVQKQQQKHGAAKFKGQNAAKCSPLAPINAFRVPSAFANVGVISRKRRSADGPIHRAVYWSMKSGTVKFFLCVFAAYYIITHGPIGCIVLLVKAFLLLAINYAGLYFDGALGLIFAAWFGAIFFWGR